jgi:nicotinamidase-related amidase
LVAYSPEVAAMTRRQLLITVAALPAAAIPQAEARLTLAARKRTGAGPMTQQLEWSARETAVIVCDMWDDHYCLSAVGRLEAMIPRMNAALAAARRLGVHVIHAPSGTMDFYAAYPQRKRMQAIPYAKPPVEIAKWRHLDPKDEAALPIADDEEPCDDLTPRARIRMYSREHPSIRIEESDGISDDGQEIFNYLTANGVENVILMGVHANMCVLGRPFGIRQQVRLGKRVALVRDLTDAMYDPRDEPYVSHARGTELVIEHIERWWAPSILSEELIRAGGPATD